MGQGASRADGRRASELEPVSKVGKTKGLNVTLLTARERAELVARSLNEQRRDKSEREKLDELISLKNAEQREKTVGVDSNRTLNPPLEGCIRGEEWNRYVDHLWGQEKRSVIHTILLPKGRNPKEISFYKARLLGNRSAVLHAGAIPTTVSAPQSTFEAYVDPDCGQIKFGNFSCMPRHFLVVDAKLPEDTLKIARKLTQELEEKGELPGKKKAEEKPVAGGKEVPKSPEAPSKSPAAGKS
eukprot:Gregarina_sp_Poly_1__561@NODE_1134_length_4985_cov_108_670394_g783_i0_p4_GENE_NODE_1134_length_4985_cov_108_670394_g783_i0NODE_1134_length_4985_cov_108_670394_g783_i0_p4_ORF_typecomplete_len242_score44_70_NODE_1134_length_4985_cov_108_670394_g783_i017622487